VEEAVRNWIRKATAEGSKEGLYELLTEKFASMVIKEALNITGGKRSRAAKLLGLSRPIVQAKMEKYGLKIHSSVVERGNRSNYQLIANSWG